MNQEKHLKLKKHIEDSNRDIVIIGSGSSADKYKWHSERYLVFCCNFSFRKYKGFPQYSVIADEHIDFIVPKMPTWLPEKAPIINVNEWMINTFDTVRTGSAIVFIHYILKTHKNKKIILQGVDFDNGEIRWSKYEESLRVMTYDLKDRGNVVYTVSDNFTPPYFERWEFEKV